jgi:hypothetical protein
MAPNSQKAESSPTASPKQSSTQESQAAPQPEVKKPDPEVEEIVIKAEKPAKKKATTPNNPEGVTQDNDQHYTIR